MDTSPPDAPKRKQVRLSYYDYSAPGAYFVTVCCQDMRTFFGTVTNSNVCLNPLGRIAYAELEQLNEHHNALADTFVVMPNHIHAVIFLDPQHFSESLRRLGDPRTAPIKETPQPLGVVVSLYQQAVTSQVRTLTGNPELQLWQRGFHEHIIRDDEDLQTRRQYILDNPQRWSDKNRQ